MGMQVRGVEVQVRVRVQMKAGGEIQGARMKIAWLISWMRSGMIRLNLYLYFYLPWLVRWGMLGMGGDVYFGWDHRTREVIDRSVEMCVWVMMEGGLGVVLWLCLCLWLVFWVDREKMDFGMGWMDMEWIGMGWDGMGWCIWMAFWLRNGRGKSKSKGEGKSKGKGKGGLSI